MRLIISIFFVLLLSLQNLWAVRAYPYPITITEPDGGKLTILLHGDEFFHYSTTLDGKIIAQNKEGYFCYANYINGKIEFSPRTALSPSCQSTTGKSILFQLSGGSNEITRENVVMITDANKNNKISREGIACSNLFSCSPLKILIIPVEFADLKFSIDNLEEHFNKMFNETGYSEFGATGSVRDYFQANIPDLEFVFDISQKVTLSHDFTYYGDNDESTPSVLIYDKKLNELVKEACQAIDNATDFSQYDNNNDGKIDYIFIFFAGHNEAECGLKETLWPQTGNFSNNSYKFDGKSVSVFSCTSELSGSEESIPAGIGTVCHEISHFLGLKDLYDTDSGKGGLSNCLWKNLSIMDAGNYNNNGKTPPYYCAIDRELLGRIEYQNGIIDSLADLEPIDKNGKVMIIHTENDGEYFLIENRFESGWDTYIGGSGMVIYHIDKSYNNVNGIQAKVRWDNNLINTCADHECADLIEAYSDAININQVFFPGQAQIDEFSTETNPPFVDWHGNPAGYKITKIKQRGENINFKLERDSSDVNIIPVNFQTKIFQRRAIIKWDCEKSGNFSWGIEWGLNARESEIHKLKTTDKQYTLKELEPKENYYCKIYHIGKYHNGDTVKLEFTTEAVTSPYPKIEGIANSYQTGDKVDLIVENLSEEVNSIMWYVNNVKIFNDNYKFREEGNYEIKAVINYASDNSREVIIKNVTVSTSQNEK